MRHSRMTKGASFADLLTPYIFLQLYVLGGFIVTYLIVYM